jgi:hypothetical protein
MQEMLIVLIVVGLRYRIIVMMEIADRIIAMLHNVFKTIVIVIVVIVIVVNNLMKRII